MKIRNISQSNILLYSILFCVAMNIKIGLVGICDIIAVLVACYSLAKSSQHHIQQSLLPITLVPASFLLLDVFVKIFFYGETVNIKSFEFIFKFLMILVYGFVFYHRNFEKINCTVVIWILMLPILVSTIMYFSASFESIIVQLYGDIERSSTSRFGGIYGKNVNTFGFYITVVLLFFVFLRKKREIGKLTQLVLLVDGLFMLILSGMRAGVIAAALAFLLTRFINLNEKGKIHIVIKQINFKRFFVYLFLLIFVLLFIILIVRMLPEDVLQSILYRFSWEKFTNDIFSFDLAAGSNRYVAQEYLRRQITLCRHRSILWGYDISQGYVDMGYIDVFIRHGLIGISAFCYFTVTLYKKLRHKIYRNDMLFFLFFSFLISLKGVFVTDVKYIILSLLLIFLGEAKSKVR